MLISIKFNAAIFQQVTKKNQSIRISQRGTIYGILAVCNWLPLEQTLGNAVALGDYFWLSSRNYKLTGALALGALFAESACTARAELPDEHQRVEGSYSRFCPCKRFTQVTNKPSPPPRLQKAIDSCSIRQKWDCHSLRGRRENCLIWFSIAIWVFGSYFTVVITKGNEVCFCDVTRCFSFHYNLDE